MLPELSQRNDLGEQLGEYRDRCFAITYYFEDQYISLPWPLAENAPDPIYYVKVGDPDHLYKATLRYCGERGVFGGEWGFDRSLAPRKISDLRGKEAEEVYRAVTHLLKQPRREPEPENMWEV